MGAPHAAQEGRQLWPTHLLPAHWPSKECFAHCTCPRFPLPPLAIPEDVPWGQMDLSYLERDAYQRLFETELAAAEELRSVGAQKAAWQGAAAEACAAHSRAWSPPAGIHTR